MALDVGDFMAWRCHYTKVFNRNYRELPKVILFCEEGGLIHPPDYWPKCVCKEQNHLGVLKMFAIMLNNSIDPVYDDGTGSNDGSTTTTTTNGNHVCKYLIFQSYQYDL